ncbi:MAG: glycine oxidase ThiO [Exilibacterium sp.]
MNTSSNHHIAIAGAGLLGRLLAWRLQRFGHRVTLFEAGPLRTPAAAAHTAAGMIAPASEAVACEPSIYRMGIKSLKLWPQWLRQLSIESNAPDDSVDFQQNGSLVVAHAQDFNALKQFQQNLHHTLSDSGEPDPYRWVDSESIQTLEPDLAGTFHQGIFLNAEAHIDNRALLQSLLREIERLGADCHEHAEVEVAPYQILRGGAAQRFDLVLDCRGVGAKKQWRELRGVRGEVLRVQTPEVHLNRPVRLMHPRYQLYVVPKRDHCFVIGATQIESEDRRPVTLRSTLELSSALYTINPAFAEANILESGVNLRPGFADNLPRVEQQPGLIRANGLFRHGYLLAPVVVNQVLALIPPCQRADDSITSVNSVHPGQRNT